MIFYHMRNITMSIKLVLSLCVVLFLLTSCAIYRTTAVSEAEKVGTDIYDGAYIGTHFNKSPRQTSHFNGIKMVSRCTAFNRDVTWSVADGVLHGIERVFRGINGFSTNIDSSGGFYVKDIPTERYRIYTISSVKTRVPVTLTVMGKIEREKLTATVYMVSKVNNSEHRGCRSYVELER